MIRTSQHTVLHPDHRLDRDEAMNVQRRARLAPVAVAVLSALTLAACGGGGGDAAQDDRAEPLNGPKATEVVPGPSNVVTRWHEAAIATINVPASPTGATIEERVGGPDIATVQVAVYDAAMAIAGTHKPFYATPSSATAGASMEAAITEAAYRVLSGLFPSRAAVYAPVYATELAAIADGVAKSQGMALGAEVAQTVLARRANDGRAAVLALPAYVPGTAPGEFRGVNPVGRQNTYIRPFALSSAAQFRPDPPPALTSERYALDLAEVQAIGGTVSALRTALQLDIARFHTDSPAVGQYRNQRRFATAGADLADNARVLAMLSVATADAGIGCFEAKYHYNAWRPQSAIPLADGDGNPATIADPGWTPVVTTPNHPEYPAGHGCGTGATVEVLRQFYGTKKVTFIWDTLVPSVVEKTRRYESTDALIREVIDARVHGGMHFRYGVEAGAELGRKTAQWALRHHFGPK
jgi:hypothetical protein